MSRPPVGPNPCLACGSQTVRQSIPAHAICAICRDLSYAAFRRQNRGLDPSEWQRRLNAFHSDIQARVALARASLMVAV